MSLIGVNEVQEILGIAESSAYRVMQQLNRELKDKGYLVCRGRISKDYLLERYGLTGNEASDDSRTEMV